MSSLELIRICKSNDQVKKSVKDMPRRTSQNPICAFALYDEEAYRITPVRHTDSIKMNCAPMELAN